MKWLAFLGKHYKEQKKKSPDYKYKQAMKDAVKPYRKHLSGGTLEEDEAAERLKAEAEAERLKAEAVPPSTPGAVQASVSAQSSTTTPGAVPETGKDPQVQPSTPAPVQASTQSSTPGTGGGRRRSRKGRRSAKRRNTSKRR